MSKKAATEEVSPAVNGAAVPANTPAAGTIEYDIAGIKHALGVLTLTVNELSSTQRDLMKTELVEGVALHSFGEPAVPEIPPEIIEKLKKPFPAAALSEIKGGSLAGMTNIKSIYHSERLNDVFGVNGWTLDTQTETVTTDKTSDKMGVMVVLRCTLRVPKYGIVRESFGGNDNKDLGNAYKGAQSDALSKLCSMIYIGQDVYKGNGDGAAAAAAAVEAEAKKKATAKQAPAPALKAATAVPEPPPATAPTPTSVPAPIPAPVEAPAQPVAEVQPVAEAKPVAAATTATGGLICKGCSNQVTEFVVNGQTYSPEQLVKNSQHKYQLDLCAGCQQARAKASKTAGGNRVGAA